jgi:amino acid transporter
MLSADYVITISLSVLDGCHYLALPKPEYWAIGLILLTGTLNWFGPRHAGSVAIAISTVTVIILGILVVAVYPHVIENVKIQPAPGGFFTNWSFFVAIILSISGIESISNLTGVMKDPAKNSRKAILSVLAKISVVTIVLGLAMNAIPNLSQTEHKEEMIRYVGEFYIGSWFGPFVGIVLGFLLISAGNTAINALTSIQFLMAVDGELPRNLRKLNRHGVPIIPLIIATIIPITVLLWIQDVITLSSLYAIGVVGAVMINVASTSTDRSLKISSWIRLFMIISALTLGFIELTIAIEKTKALLFALTVLVLGLSARVVARRGRVIVAVPVPAAPVPEITVAQPVYAPMGSRMLVAVRGGGQRLLHQACEEAKLRKAFLFVLQVKQISVTGILPDIVPGEAFTNGEWMSKICQEYNVPFKVISVISNEVGYTIAEQAATLGVERLILGATQRSLVDKALRGDVIRMVSELLPEDIQLIIYRS